jgi:hypothetical protein
MLIHILPSHDWPEYANNQLLVKIVRTLFPSKTSTFVESEISETNYQIWSQAIEIVLKSIVEELESHQTLSNLMSTIHKNEKEAIDFLREVFHFKDQFYSFFVKKSIYPNQRGKFCMLENLKDGSSIPDKLKNALFILSKKKNDIRNTLIDDRLQQILSSKEDPKRLCYDLDAIIYDIYMNPSQRREEGVKENVGYAAYDWMEKHEEWFPRCWKEMNQIIVTMVLDNSDIQTLIEVKDIPKHLIQIVKNDPESVQQYQEDKEEFKEYKANKSKYQQFQQEKGKFEKYIEEKANFEQFMKEKAQREEREREYQEAERRWIEQWHRFQEAASARAALEREERERQEREREQRRHERELRLRGNPQQVFAEVRDVVDRRFRDFIPEGFWQFVDGFAEFNQNTLENIKTKYKGQAFVFKMLRKSDKFREVTWMNLSPTKTDLRIDDFEEEIFRSKRVVFHTASRRRQPTKKHFSLK